MIPTRYAVALVSLVFVIGFCAPVRAQDPTTGPLVSLSNLVYEGAFCLPQTSTSGPGNPNSFHDGGEAMGFDPYTGQMVVMGNYRYGNAARVTMPAPSTSSCPRGALVGSWLDMQWRFPNRDPGALDTRIGGFLPQANGDLIISWFIYYDASSAQSTSHVRFSNGVASNKVLVGNTAGEARHTGGWMFTVPAEWQPLMGGPAMTGNGSLSIISNTSNGPSGWVFDPAAVTGAGPVPAKALIHYPYQHPTLGVCETGLTWNCGAGNNRAGLTWVHGTRTLIYAHRICANGDVQYSGGYFCGPSGVITRLLFYDANDLIPVNNGQKQPWEVVPYANVDPGAPLSGRVPISITHDPTTGRLFIAERWGDGPQPKIHVYRVSGSGGTTPPPPPPPAEVCGDGIDNDGDGQIDEDCTTPPPPPPSGESPDCTEAVTVTDSGGAVWTLSASNQTLRDGQHVGGGFGLVYLYYAQTVHVLGTDNLRWWRWSGSGWGLTTKPSCTVAPPPPPPDTIAPSVLVHASPSPATVGGLVALGADALDNVGVVDVRFEVNGTHVTTDSVAPYQAHFTPKAAGSYTVTATARDAAGLTGSSTTTVTASDPPTPPVNPCVDDPFLIRPRWWPGDGETVRPGFEVLSGHQWISFTYTKTSVVVTDYRGCQATVAR